MSFGIFCEFKRDTKQPKIFYRNISLVFINRNIEDYETKEARVEKEGAVTGFF